MNFVKTTIKSKKNFRGSLQIRNCEVVSYNQGNNVARYGGSRVMPPRPKHVQPGIRHKIVVKNANYYSPKINELGSFEEEMEVQKKLMEDSFAYVAAAGSLSPEEVIQARAHFLQYISTLSRSIFIFHHSTDLKLIPLFEKVCDHGVEQILYVTKVIELSDQPSVYTFLRACFGICTSFGLRNRQIELYDRMLELNLRIHPAIYQRILLVFNDRSDFCRLTKTWLSIPEEDLKLSHCETAISGSLLENFGMATEILTVIEKINRNSILDDPSAIFRIFYKFFFFQNYAHTDTPENMTIYFERIMSACLAVSKIMDSPDFVEKEPNEKEKLLNLLSSCGQLVWSELVLTEKYVNSTGKIEIYETMIGLCLHLENGLQIAQCVFNEIIINKITPRTETMNALMAVCLKFDDYILAEKIFRKINFDRTIFEPNQETFGIALKLGIPLDGLDKQSIE